MCSGTLTRDGSGDLTPEKETPEKETPQDPKGTLQDLLQLLLGQGRVPVPLELLLSTQPSPAAKLQYIQVQFHHHTET